MTEDEVLVKLEKAGWKYAIKNGPYGKSIEVEYRTYADQVFPTSFVAGSWPALKGEIERMLRAGELERK